MAPMSTKVGHGLAKVLGIKLDYRHETGEEKLSRGESVFSVSSADTYVEEEPTSWEWITDQIPSKRGWINYFFSLFPFLSWITRYNMQWFIGDLVAGITIGAVVVPQGMAYALLAKLPVQFGLYSAFMGTLIYWIFATSKDITIGPVAVMSTITGNVIIEVQKHHKTLPAQVIASALAIICGAVIAFLGIIRLGWIVDFISLTAVCAFITGSAFYIAVGQVPALMGISSTYVNNRLPAYRVVILTLQHLDKTQLDAAIGLTGLLMLYLIKYSFMFLAKKYPNKRKIFFFMNTLRTVFVILLYTLISWLVNRHRKKHTAFKTLGVVPRGFTAAGVPDINIAIIKTFTTQIPVSVIVLLIEHIAIAKSFGRINNYTINPSQELLAIGATNLLGPFLGAYPVTGSFSRTAIKSKAGVRTPLAGVITAIVVLLAIYALKAVFFYIPNATLSAVIIHAVLDLITPANTVYQFWRISPLEVIIFIAGVLVTVFSSIENGIYVVVAVSGGLLLWRVAKAQGRFLGAVKIHSVVGDHLGDNNVENNDKTGTGFVSNPVRSRDDESSTRNVFLPINHRDGSNPSIQLDTPYPGIFIYRFSEGFNYPNASHYLDAMVQTISSETRRTDPNTFGRPGDRPWNEPGPKKGQEKAKDHLPTLKAVIMDFSSVNNIDVTSVQNLIDVRNQLDRYASPEPVEWHIACINNRWTKRALASAGFGYPTTMDAVGDYHRWKPIFSVAEIGGYDSAATAAENEANLTRRHSDLEGGQNFSSPHKDQDGRTPAEKDVELQKQLSSSRAYAGRGGSSRVAVVQGLNRPLFHIDLTSALQSAVASTKRREDAVTYQSDTPPNGVETELDAIHGGQPVPG